MHGVLRHFPHLAGLGGMCLADERLAGLHFARRSPSVGGGFSRCTGFYANFRILLDWVACARRMSGLTGCISCGDRRASSASFSRCTGFCANFRILLDWGACARRMSGLTACTSRGDRRASAAAFSRCMGFCANFRIVGVDDRVGRTGAVLRTGCRRLGPPRGATSGSRSGSSFGGGSRCKGSCAPVSPSPLGGAVANIAGCILANSVTEGSFNSRSKNTHCAIRGK